MTFDAGNRLKVHINQIIDVPSKSSDIIEVMRLTRQVIEQDEGRSLYPHLSLYCDWVQHVEIDRHKHGFLVLERINDITLRHWADTKGFVPAVSAALGIGPLRQELLLLFMSKGIQTVLFDRLSNWKA